MQGIGQTLPLVESEFGIRELLWQGREKEAAADRTAEVVSCG